MNKLIALLFACVTLALIHACDTSKKTPVIHDNGIPIDTTDHDVILIDSTKCAFQLKCDHEGIDSIDLTIHDVADSTRYVMLRFAILGDDKSNYKNDILRSINEVNEYLGQRNMMALPVTIESNEYLNFTVQDFKEDYQLEEKILAPIQDPNVINIFVLPGDKPGIFQPTLGYVWPVYDDVLHNITTEPRRNRVILSYTGLKTPYTLAHEIYHFLGNPHHSDNCNLMYWLSRHCAVGITEGQLDTSEYIISLRTNITMLE